MAGPLDFLFGANPLPKVTTQDTRSTTYPSWYQNYLSSLLGKSSGIAAEPYQPYNQPRIAPTSADTSSAYNMVRQGIGQFQPQFQQGASNVAAGSTPFTQGGFNQFFNPYVNSVVDRIGTLAGRNLGENLLPQVNDTFIKGGSFGGTRNQDFTLRALRDTNEAALAQQNQALAQGFDTSMSNYQNALQRQLQGGQTQANLAQLGQGLNLQDAAALQGVGQAQEDKTQQSLNLGYQDFLEQRNWPRSTVDWLSSVMRGINPPSTTTQTSTGPATTNQLAPNSLAQIAGTALGLYGLGGFKRGGRARPRPMPKSAASKVDLTLPSAKGISQYALTAV